MILCHGINEIVELWQTLSGQCRNEGNLGIRHKGKNVSHLIGIFVYRLIILLHGIPFVYGDNDRLAAFMCDSGDLRILLGHTLDRINNQNHNIRTLYRTYGTYNHVTLEFFLNFILAAKSCRINQDIFFSIVLYKGIHCISCCSGNIGYDQTVLADQAVNQGRLADIRLSNDGNPRLIVFFLFTLSFFKISGHDIKHIANA